MLELFCCCCCTVPHTRVVCTSHSISPQLSLAVYSVSHSMFTLPLTRYSPSLPTLAHPAQPRRVKDPRAPRLSTAPLTGRRPHSVTARPRALRHRHHRPLHSQKPPQWQFSAGPRSVRNPPARPPASTANPPRFRRPHLAARHRTARPLLPPQLVRLSHLHVHLGRLRILPRGR